ncbi:MAG: hypothetical protein LQ340_000661 [Diploschistes diacapsis]|nr:MAG: hypothetical protein LQ340_000661 [Diploschistes diacapsis]
MDPSANCFIIRANGRNPVAADISSQIAPLDLKSYGRGEAYEKKELCQRLGWQQVWSMTEEINFYGHEGEDGWYYFAYGPNQEQMRLRSLQDKTDNLPKGPKWNGIASMLTDGKRDIWGDVAVVRSGPASPSNKYEEVFNGKDLEATLNWYLKGRKVGKIYDEREKSRAMRMYFGNGSAMNMNGAQYMNFKF